MGAKIRFDRKSIEDAAFAVVETRGLKALNARSLAYELNSSTQPIFSNFASMDEVKETVLDRSISIFRQYIDTGIAHQNPVVGLSLALAKFVREKRFIYEFLVLEPEEGILKPDFDRLGTILTNYISKSCALPIKVANIVFLESWIFANGIAQQIYAGLLSMNEKALAGLIESQFQGSVAAVKAKFSKR